MSSKQGTVCVFCRVTNSDVDDLGLCARCRERMAAAGLSEADVERLVRYRNHQSRTVPDDD